jgi:hypothetical protein
MGFFMDLSLPFGPGDTDEAGAFRPRRGRRMTIGQQTQLRSTEQQAMDVTVCDLSTGGFMAHCMRPVLIGSYVSLDLPGIGPVHAQVRWQVGGRMGAKFLDPVGVHRCDWLEPEG